jgi:hypothetical protein
MPIRTQFLQALSVQEAAYLGFTHVAVIRAGVEVTETGVAVPQTIKLGTQRVGEVIRRCIVSLITPFNDISDAAFNTTTLIVKTLTSAGADKTVLHTGLELNVNGTEMSADAVNNTPTGPALVNETLVAVVTGMAGKALANLDVGTVHIYFEIVAPIVLGQALAQPVGFQGDKMQGLTMDQRVTLTGKSVEQLQAEDEEEAKEAQERAAKAHGEAGSEDEDVNYEEKTVAELKELANERGVDVPYDARKDEIIKALKKAEKEEAKETAKA